MHVPGARGCRRLLQQSGAETPQSTELLRAQRRAEEGSIASYRLQEWLTQVSCIGARGRAIKSQAGKHPRRRQELKTTTLVVIVLATKVGPKIPQKRQTSFAINEASQTIWLRKHQTEGH